MKDLIAKLKSDATCAMGALWIHMDSREAHIDAQAARIAELEAQIAAASALVAGAEWKSLNDVQWMNIVNHDHAYFGWDKEDAVHHAVKATEAKLRELNATALQAPVCEVPGYKLVPVAITEAMHVAAVKAIIRSTGNDDCPPNVWRAMLAAAPLPAAPVQQEPKP